MPQYESGQDVLLGDKVRSGPSDAHDADKWVGEVVFIVDPPAFSAGFPRGEWQHLESGFMVRFGDGKLIHYIGGEPELALVARAG